MLPPRLKLRTLIVLVALATLAVGAVAYQERAARYRAMAAREAEFEMLDRKLVSTYLRNAEDCRQEMDRAHKMAGGHISEWQEIRRSFMALAQSASAEANRYARRRAAYLRCARYPWLSPPGEEAGPK